MVVRVINLDSQLWMRLMQFIVNVCNIRIPVGGEEVEERRL